MQCALQWAKAATWMLTDCKKLTGDYSAPRAPLVFRGHNVLCVNVENSVVPSLYQFSNGTRRSFAAHPPRNDCDIGSMWYANARWCSRYISLLCCGTDAVETDGKALERAALLERLNELDSELLGLVALISQSKRHSSLSICCRMRAQVRIQPM